MYLFVEEWPSEKSVAVAASYFSADTWVAIAGVYDGANAYVYINGVVRGGPTAITNGPTTSTYNFFIGKSPQGGLSSPQFSGSMDEVRFSSTARSAQWIATEYNNQSAPETFILDGTPSAPASPSTVSSIGSVTGVSSITY